MIGRLRLILNGLKSNNGDMNTLATDGASKFDFTVQNDGMEVMLKTKVVTAKITGTLIDEQPIAIYTINKDLLPKELFKAQAETPAPALALDVTMDSPKPSTKKSKKAPSPSDEANTPSSTDDAVDQVADQNAAVRFDGTRFGSLIVIAKLEGPAVSQYCALRLLQATLGESLYELAGELEYLQRERYGSARLENFASGLELIGQKLQMGTLQSRLDVEFLLAHMCSVKFKEWIVVLATLLRRSEKTRTHQHKIFRLVIQIAKSKPTNTENPNPNPGILRLKTKITKMSRGFLFLGINLCVYENGGMDLKKKERKKKKEEEEEEEQKKKHWSGSEEERKIKKKTRKKKSLGVGLKKKERKKRKEEEERKCRW
ncbi:hypothetical protein SO802_009879 [Lithocarpus litseifolius]|uniref:Uncharacterized protein n=1 Tax=Lithocarpus litseifolius TaxID=425828 RepID=A0AAW2DCQ5_9ROSI